MNKLFDIFKSKKTTQDAQEDLESFNSFVGDLTPSPNRRSPGFNAFSSKSNFDDMDMDKLNEISEKNGKTLDRNYQGYYVNFDSVFTVKEMKEGFMKHLQIEHNTGNFIHF